MIRILTINGMHCEACKTLIQMTLEENNLAQKIKSIELISQKNQAKLALQDPTDQDISSIKKIINSLGQYRVE
ncbi:MAG: hypothetical protein JW816_00750 [Candidatus Buchananbacteria bacterium]|nr:hypothetical protein [Candidatus Buchananbacteria bacterium]